MGALCPKRREEEEGEEEEQREQQGWLWSTSQQEQQQQEEQQEVPQWPEEEGDLRIWWPYAAPRRGPTLQQELHEE